MSNTPGQEPRGDAALRQAIATGSPVPTNGKQAGELPRIDEWFSVGGSIVASDKQGCICFLTDEDGKRVVIDADTPDAEVMRLDANSRMICAAPTLHAYAKAEHLSVQLSDLISLFGNESAVCEYALQILESYLATMGWVAGTDIFDFLDTYRTDALAQAEGKQ
jgi:hypothetical protein